MTLPKIQSLFVSCVTRKLTDNGKSPSRTFQSADKAKPFFQQGRSPTQTGEGLAAGCYHVAAI